MDVFVQPFELHHPYWFLVSWMYLYPPSNYTILTGSLSRNLSVYCMNWSFRGRCLPNSTGRLEQRVAYHAWIYRWLLPVLSSCMHHASSDYVSELRHVTQPCDRLQQRDVFGNLWSGLTCMVRGTCLTSFIRSRDKFGIAFPKLYWA